VHIISPGDNTVTREAQVHVKASIVSETEVTDITISVNGRPAWKYRKSVMVVPKLEGSVVEQTVPLEAGRNVISVIARNENAVSQPAMITITYSKPVVRKPCLYALIVGVSDYTDSNYDLRYAHKDAQAVWDVFKDQKGKLFSDVKAKVLLNSDATKDNILDGLDWLISEATQKDVGIVFISGHGVHDQRRNYYFLPHDGDGDRLRRTAVNWYEFQDTLSSIPSKAMLFVDTCHAAMAAGKTKGSAGMDITEIIADLAADESGVVVMASSTGREVSIELDELKHGAFTKALVEGLLGRRTTTRMVPSI